MDLNTLSEQDKAKLLQSTAVMDSLTRRHFQNFLKQYTKNVSIDELMQDFFQSLKFENGKGILAKLSDYGEFDELDDKGDRVGVNRELVEQVKNHTISLKALSENAGFWQNNLNNNNALGKPMIMAMIQQFTEKLESQLSGRIATETRQRWEEIKKHYTDKKAVSLYDFIADVNSLFKEEYNR